jgi:POTRA domain-containing FtsQ-type protein
MRAGYQSRPSWRKPAQKRRRRRALVLILVVALLALAAPLLARPTVNALGSLAPFQVHAVELTGLLYLAPDELRSRIPVKDGDNLLLVSPAKIEAALKKNARVEAVRVTRYPGKVQVFVVERRTFVLVNAGGLLEVDSDGTVLTPLRRGLIADRPVVTGLRLSPTAPGARIPGRRVQELLHLVHLLEAPEVGLISEISEIAADTPGRVVMRTSRDQIPILVDPERVTLAAMRAVAATLRDVRERDRRVIVLDARYKGQVVVRCAPPTIDSTQQIDPPGKV